MSTAAEDLLRAIEAIYNVAISPTQYESFAEDLDDFISGLDPESEHAVNLLAHIDKAMSILERLEGLSDDEENPQGLVDAEPGAAALGTVDGHVIACNVAWKINHGEAEKSIWRMAPSEEDQDRIRSATKTLHEVTERRTNFARFVGKDDDFIHLTISRLSDSRPTGQPTRYLFRSGKTLWSETIGELMTSEFAFTPAETALLRRMVLGDSFATIAEDTGKGIETLKSQSKSLYRKMQVSGREDAVRVAYQLHLLLQSAHVLKKPSNPPNRAGTVKRHDGRLVAWTQKGAPGGDPVLFLHGMSLGHGFTRGFERLLIERNIRLICLDRPGYGYSDPPQDWRNNVEEWINVFPSILDGLQLKRIPILTHTSGVLYGCAAASAHPDRVQQVCSLAGGVPITDAHMLADYPSQIRILSRASRFSPSLLRFVFSSSAAFYRSEKGRTRIIRKTYGSVPVDAKALENPEIAECVHEGMAMINMAGFDGFIGDGLRIFGDWSEYVRDMKVPLHYIVGEDDPICPLRWAQAFAQRYTHVDVIGVPGAGQLLQHTHARQVMDILDGFRPGLGPLT